MANTTTKHISKASKNHKKIKMKTQKKMTQKSIKGSSDNRLMTTGLLDAVSKKACCTGAKKVCTGANEVLGGEQKTLGRPLLPQSKRSLAPSPNHFGDFPCSGSFPGPRLPKSSFIFLHRVRRGEPEGVRKHLLSK